MKVIIPAAGFGSRLRPYTFTVPKSLLPVAGKPVLGYIIDQAISLNAEKITVVCGYMQDQIRSYLSAYNDYAYDFRIQEKPLGLGHAVYLGLDATDDDVLIILGDTIAIADYETVISRGKTAFGVHRVSDPRKFGVVVLEENKVVQLIEKPQEPISNLALVGVYYIKKGALLREALHEIMEKDIRVKNEFQLTDALQMMLKQGEYPEIFYTDEWFDCGTPQALVNCNRFLLEQNGGFHGQANIEDSVILPPVFLADGVEIKRAIVGPYVSIGPRTTICDTVIKNSIVGERATVSNVVLSQTMLGNRTELIGRHREIHLGASTGLRL